MQRTKLINCLLLSGVVILSSCSQEPIPVSRQENYNRDFIKNFGVFDPSHDWNLARHATVTVTTESPTDIKVYADVKGVRYNFGTFTNVSGTQTLGVDVPQSVDKLIVRANGIAYDVVPDGSVVIKSRAASYAAAQSGSEANGVKLSDGSDPSRPLRVSYNTDESTWLKRRGDYVAKYNDILPEGLPSLSSPDVTLNFRFHAEAGQTVTIYPAFWDTSASNILGIYYTNAAGEYIEQDLYQIKTTDVIEKWIIERSTGDDTWTFWQNDLKPYLAGIGADENASSLTPEQWEQMKQALMKAGYEFTKFEPREGTLAVDYQGCVWRKDTGWHQQQMSLNIKNVDLTTRYFTFKGFNVTFPESVDFGMYLRTSAHSSPLYSESWKNDIHYTLDTTFPYKVVDGMRIYDTKTKVKPYKPSFTATFTREDLNDDDNRRICFEDWVAVDGDYDLNDMVFYMSGVKESDVIEGDDPWVDNYYEWIIAAEDLGDNDFDFNDVVFGVHTVKYDADTDRSTIRVRALAAGGTLPVYLYHKDYMGGQTPLQPEGAQTAEFHTGWFNGSHTSATVINARSYRSLGRQMEFDVPGKFTMSCQTGVENQNMGGFSIRVDYEHGKEFITPPNLSAEIGEAPQMICVSNEWRWPKERIHILDPYGSFKDWVANQGCNDWHHTPSDASLVWPRTDIPTAPGNGSGGGSNGGGNTPSRPEAPGPDNSIPSNPAGALCPGIIPDNPQQHGHHEVIYSFSPGVISENTTSVTLNILGMDNVDTIDIIKGFGDSEWDKLPDGWNTLQVKYAKTLSVTFTDPEKIKWLRENQRFTIVYWTYAEGGISPTMKPLVYMEAK